MTDDPTPEAEEPRRPVPDLGFFGGAPSQLGGSAHSQFGGPPPSQFGGPAPSQFGGPAPSQFGGPAASQFGGPAASQFGAPAPSPFGAPAPTQFGGPAPYPFGGPVTHANGLPGSTRGGMPGWAIALLVVVGGLVALVLVASVAIPVFLNQRAKGIAARTTIEMPTQIEGFVRVDDPTAAMGEQIFERSIGREVAMRDVQAGVYRRGAVQAFVLAARPIEALSRAQQEAVAAGFVRGIEQETGFPPVLAPVLRGSLTGTFGCAQINGGQTPQVVCLATSPGAMVVVAVAGASYDGATEAAVSLREGVEHQT